MRRLIVAGVAVVALLAAAGWWLGLPSVLAPMPPVPSLPAASPAGAPSGTPLALTGAERAWAAGFRAALAPAEAAAGDLVRLGEGKSRDLFAIRGGQARMNDALGTADAYLAASPAPAALGGVAADYRAGAALVRQAMAEAMAGFVRLDWGRVRAATGEMRAGQASLARALAVLDALPTATPSPGA